jgi:hypothetical protein
MVAFPDRKPTEGEETVSAAVPEIVPKQDEYTLVRV